MSRYLASALVTFAVAAATSATVHADILYSVTDVGALVANGSSMAYDVNNNGQVTGRSDKSNGGYAAFLYSNGSMSQLGPTYEQAIGYGINNNGQVVGFSDGGLPGYWAFTYSSGTLTFLTPHTGTPYSEARDINDSGQITGFLESPYRAFLYANGTMVVLGISGNTFGQAINASGQIAGTQGSRFSGSSNNLAFLYTNGVTQFLGTLGGDQSDASAINDSGQVVGFSRVTNDINLYHAFLYSNGLMTDLGTLGGTGTSFASDINNFGQVVGSSNGAAVLYSQGAVLNLNAIIDPALGWNLTSASAISDTGYIAGTGTNAAGQQHAFLLTPIPSPSSAACLTIPLLVLTLTRRRILSPEGPRT